MQIIRQSSFVAVPWKNGGGITHEAIRVPAKGEPFRWRVSVAHIEVSGPFSDFSAYNRTMVLLRGCGVALNFSSGAGHVLHRIGDMAEFDGALATQCELLNGPCVDLNLMASKTLQDVRARVERFEGRLSLPAAGDRSTVVFPIDAPVELRVGGATATLGAWDLAVIPGSQDSAGLALREPFAAGTVFLATLPDA
jgi:uncharacterized protein